MLHAAGDALPLAGERRHQLLVLLAMHDGDWVPRDRVAGIFWPDRPNDEARRNLRKVIFRAREMPGTAALEVTDHALRRPVASDLGELRRALRTDAASQALEDFSGALCTGLEGDGSGAFGDWLAAEREGVVTQWREACHPTRAW